MYSAVKQTPPLRSFVDLSLLTSAAVSAALLAGAHLFEAAGYAPCDLCMDQREAHWAGFAVTGAGLAASLVWRARLAAAAAVGAAALVYAISAGLALYHTGVEFGYWPGPPTCSGGGALPDTIDLTTAFSSDGPRVSCTDAAWRFLGISMAGYNFLFSGGLFVLCLGAAVATTRRVRHDAATGGSA
ncbi:MAG: disulfide bond formation protein B [Pseudomonadota bacterium]